MNYTMIQYYILINSEGKAIVVDYKTNTDKCDAGIGYETNFNAWKTNKKEYMAEDLIFFDIENVFKESGIYKVDGFVDVLYAPEGYYFDFKVVDVIKIDNLPYQI